MATQSCLNNIKKEIPPVYCGDLCGRIQGKINKYCEHNGLGGDVPVPQWSEATGDCWCCCSCMAWGTPIEVSPGNYRMIEMIVPGMKVIATGGSASLWE